MKRKSTKERSHTTLTPLFSGRVTLVFTNDVSASAEALNVMAISGTEALTIWSKGHVKILVPFNTTPGVIAHEMYHATAEVLKRCGVKAGPSNQEPVAYLLGWLTDWACKKL